MSDFPHLFLLVPWLTLGGADKFNLDLVAQLTRRHSWHITIVTTKIGDNSWRALFAPHVAAIVALPETAAPDRFPAIIAETIRSRGVTHALITHSQLGYLALPFLRAHCPGVVFADYVHIEEHGWRDGGYARDSVEYATYLDTTFVSSEHLRRWLIERQFETRRPGDPTTRRPDDPQNRSDEDRISVCTTNIDATQWDPRRHDRAAIRASLGIDQYMPVILFSARLHEQKRPLLLLEIALRLEAAGHRFVCLVAGDGPERPAMERFIADHALASVRLLGAQPNARIAELLAAADCFLLPSANEGIALALFEAMAMALPAVAADVGGQRELLTPACGTLIPLDGDQADQYVAAIAPLLTDATLRRAQGEAGRTRIVAHFQLDQMGDRMDALLRAARPLPLERLPNRAAARASQRAAIALAADELRVARGSHRSLVTIARPLYHALTRNPASPLARLTLAARRFITRFLVR